MPEPSQRTDGNYRGDGGLKLDRSRLTGRSQWVVATLEQACLQEFENATFFEGIELTARRFKRGKKAALFAAEDSQGSLGATKPPVHKVLPERNSGRSTAAIAASTAKQRKDEQEGSERK